jgi:hypothetical protein
MSTFLNLGVNVPYNIGTLVYRKSDLEVLWNYPTSYENLIKYAIVGYEVSFVQDAEENSGNLTAEVGNAIMRPVKVGATLTSAGGTKYVNADLLEPSTESIEQRITSIVG